MHNEFMDRLQWLFDRLFALIPRCSEPDATEPLLVGHRGVFGHPTVKENTLSAFDLAVAHGGGIEFDIHLTRDGVVVVHHDTNLRRVHGVAGFIAELSFRQLREMAPEVPALDEVLERYGHRCPHYFLEPKVRGAREMELLAQAVDRSLEAFRLKGIATVISSDERMLDRLRATAPDVAKAFIFMISNKAAVKYAIQHGDTGLAGWYFNYPESMRDFLAARGLHQGVGQIDYRNTLRHYSNRGFHYCFTNRIDRLLRPVEPHAPQSVIQRSLEGLLTAVS